MKITNFKIPLSQTLFSAMDQVLGNEHTSNPPIIIAPISDTLIVEGASRSGTVEPVTPSPKSSPISGEEDTCTDSATPYNSGKRVKQKNDKNREIMDLMKHNLEIKEVEIEEKKKQRELLERAEEREDKLVGLMEVLVTHFVKKD